jgi:hypothetical protein
VLSSNPAVRSELDLQLLAQFDGIRVRRSLSQVVSFQPLTFPAHGSYNVAREMHGLVPKLLRKGKVQTREGETVSFLISDVFLPDSKAIREAFSGADELQGTVAGFSDSGSTPRAFALIEVIYKHTLIVPVEKLRPLEKS